MDIFIGFVTDDFHGGGWPDQEVGYAYQRGVPRVFVKLGGAGPYRYGGEGTGPSDRLGQRRPRHNRTLETGGCSIIGRHVPRPTTPRLKTRPPGLLLTLPGRILWVGRGVGVPRASSLTPKTHRELWGSLAVQLPSFDRETSQRKVRNSVCLGPPNWIKSRTFKITFTIVV